jgi:hypothetical protein
MVTALIDLRSRGADVVVIEISQSAFVTPRRGAGGALAYRLWRLDSELLRERMRAMGVPVVEWTPDRPITEVLREVEAWPRGGRWAG